MSAPPLITLEDHSEMLPANGRKGSAISLYRTYDCAAGTVELLGGNYREAQGGDRLDPELHGFPPITPRPPSRPAEGTLGARLLELACAIRDGGAAVADLPRLDHPFFRQDVD